MRRAHKSFGWTLATMITISAGSAAQACAFHGYTPNPTLVDQLLNTEQVVIARLAADRTTVRSVETLLGPKVSDVPIDLSRETRKRLAQDPTATLLLARDGAYGPWLELGVLDSRFRDVVQHVMARQSPWLLGRDRDRLTFFAKLVNDPNPDVRRLALQELDRVAYGDLRRARLPVIDGLGASLAQDDSDLTPIRVLLAGLSKDARFVPLLYAQTEKAIANDTPYLGAYATALIELRGKPAVEDLVARYLAPADLPVVTREKLLQALALHYKSSPGSLRRMISREVAALVRQTPDLRDAIERQFGYQ